MSLGFKSTLFAGVITLSAFTPAFAAAPVMLNLPDVTIGDLEDSTEATDNNVFVFTDAFTFSDFVSDADNNNAELMWSFGEYSPDGGGLADSQYAINGVTAINAGDQAIADDEASGHEKALNPGTSQINITENTASFRDIVLSPLPEASSYPDPTPQDAAAARAGKVVRYYVSDGTNLDWNEAIVRTSDDDWDSTSGVYNGQYTQVVRDIDLDSNDWTPSGFGWSAVSIGKANGELSITVQPTQAKSRFYGWANPALMNYDDVQDDRFIRGKFYIYTDVNLLAPINQVPNFRLRITHENAVNAAAHFELASTGYSDPGYEPFYASVNNPQEEGLAGFFLRPSDTFFSPCPSLYRVDFDPVDVPAAAGSNIGALMESYTVHDPANGSLFLAELVLGTYNELDNSGDLEWSYNRADGLEGGAGGPKVVSGGGFNHEANLTAGYLQDLFLAPGDPGPYFQISGNGQNDTTGVVGDSDAVPSNVFGIGLLNFASADNVNKLRIESNKLYHARFYATSSVPATSANAAEETQGGIRFRFQTAGNRVSYLLDMSTLSFGSLVGPSTPNADDIAAQALPGLNSQNQDTSDTLNTAGEDGGWYSVVVPSPLDYEGIRNDAVALYGNEPTFDESGQFFVLSAQPGPGDENDSVKDVTLGVDFIQPPLTAETSGPLYEGGRPARAHVRISAIEVYSYPRIDDGGYDLTGGSVGHPNWNQ